MSGRSSVSREIRSVIAVRRYFGYLDGLGVLSG
jgi:hypothetical protein